MSDVLYMELSPLKVAAWLVALLMITYIGLIAVIMSYAASTVEFAQNVRNDEAQVAQLEAQYLAQVAAVTSADYRSLGYAKPASVAYVEGAKATALR